MKNIQIILFVVALTITTSVLGQTKNQIINQLQGTWYSTNLSDDKERPSFEIKGDTLLRIFQKGKYKIKMNEDSTFSQMEILSKKEYKTVKPRMVLMQKVHKLTEDSLVVWNWEYGNKKYARYYKKR